MRCRAAIWLSLAMVPGAVWLASPVAAQEQRRDTREGPRFVTPLMRVLDANADGVISADEIKNASSALGKLDADGDGQLSREEFGLEQLRNQLRSQLGQLRPNAGNAAAGQPGRDGILARLKQSDRNGDGVLDKSELPEQLVNRLDQLDTNGDGKLDGTEIKRLLERMGQRARPGGAAPPRRPALRRQDAQRPTESEKP